MEYATLLNSWPHPPSLAFARVGGMRPNVKRAIDVWCRTRWCGFVGPTQEAEGLEQYGELYLTDTVGLPICIAVELRVPGSGNTGPASGSGATSDLYLQTVPDIELRMISHPMHYRSVHQDNEMEVERAVVHWEICVTASASA